MSKPAGSINCSLALYDWITCVAIVGNHYFCTYPAGIYKVTLLARLTFSHIFSETAEVEGAVERRIIDSAKVFQQQRKVWSSRHSVSAEEEQQQVISVLITECLPVANRSLNLSVICRRNGYGSFSIAIFEREVRFF